LLAIQEVTSRLFEVVEAVLTCSFADRPNLGLIGIVRETKKPLFGGCSN